MPTTPAKASQRELWGCVFAFAAVWWGGYLGAFSKSVWLGVLIVLSGADLSTGGQLDLSVNYTLGVLITALVIALPAIGFGVTAFVLWDCSFVPPSMRRNAKRS